jgi:serine/threonine protein kinase
VAARLGEPGTSAGTPPYMAPEAFLGELSVALDVYSLAATLFHLLTGELPFEAPNLQLLHVKKTLGLTEEDPRFAGVPEALERLVRAGLASGPDKRPRLIDFLDTLRGSLNQLLTDDLAQTQSQAAGGVELRLFVRRRDADGSYRQVATTRPSEPRVRRDVKKVPPTPAQMPVRTGERLRVEVTASAAGFLTVFNVGPTGNLNLLCPDSHAAGQQVAANQTLPIVEVELEPPTGRERIVALWSRRPWTGALSQLASLAEQSVDDPPRSYRASRDLKLVRQAAMQLAPEEWRVAVVELDHR